MFNKEIYKGVKKYSTKIKKIKKNQFKLTNIKNYKMI